MEKDILGFQIVMDYLFGQTMEILDRLQHLPEQNLSILLRNRFNPFQVSPQIRPLTQLQHRAHSVIVDSKRMKILDNVRMVKRGMHIGLPLDMLDVILLGDVGPAWHELVDLAGHFFELPDIEGFVDLGIPAFADQL
jgi:hypothetical protein